MDRVRKLIINKTRQIDADNELFKQGKIGYEQAVYDHHRFTKEEFLKYKTGLRYQNLSQIIRVKRAAPQTDVSTCSNAPDSINYVSTNNVSPVQNQGECGCCYIFSAVAAMESAYSIKYRKPPVKFSEENVLECFKNPTGVCNGGWMDWIYNMTMYAKGSVASSNYASYNQTPLQAYGVCNTAALKEPNTEIDHWITLPKGDEEFLKCYLAKYGPMSIGMDFSGKIGNYKSGIFEDVDKECSDTKPINHALLLVGYGSEINAAGIMTPYWLIKNQWGVNWGQSGFIKIARNRNNLCHVSSVAQLPVLKDASTVKTGINTSSCSLTQDFYNGSTYLKSSCLYMGSKTYADSNLYCKSIGMKLFNIDSALQSGFFKYVSSYVSGMSWVNGGSTCTIINSIYMGSVTVSIANCAIQTGCFCEYIDKSEFRTTSFMKTVIITFSFILKQHCLHQVSSC